MVSIFLIFLPILVLTSGLGTYWALLTSPQLSLTDKFQTLQKIYLTGFQDPLILTAVIMQAITLAILIKTIARQRKFDTRAGTGSVITTFLAGIGLGCPACGTSILIPLLSTFLTSGVIALAEFISLLIYWLIILVNVIIIVRLGWVYSQLSLAD
jgi:hypothetical protein